MKLSHLWDILLAGRGGREKIAGKSEAPSCHSFCSPSIPIISIEVLLSMPDSTLAQPVSCLGYLNYEKKSYAECIYIAVRMLGTGK